MIGADLASLVEANAWTFGPVATALRVLRLTRQRRADPGDFWEALLAQCPRMSPLGYWLRGLAAGAFALDTLEDGCRRRIDIVAGNLVRRLGPTERTLVVGHDAVIDALVARRPGALRYRYLLLDGPPGVDPPGAWTRQGLRRQQQLFDMPFGFAQLEDALDWCESVVIAGFVMHRQNLLGPPQLRPLLASAREQAEVVLLATLNEQRVALGDGSPRRYTDDFRPYLWQPAVSHLVSEWTDGAEGTQLGWLPMPLEVLQRQFGEEFTSS